MDTLEQLTGDTEATSWIPVDIYADLILEASVCYGKLSGVVTALDYDAAQGTGGIVQVRYVPARVAQGPMHACQCLSATSSTLGTYSITIQPYGDYDEMCSYSLWKANGPVKDKILNEMAKGLASARDTAIWAALIANSGQRYHLRSVASCDHPVYSASCCSLRTDLYNGIVNVAKKMEHRGMHPDYVMMDPTIAAYLYYKDGEFPPSSIMTPAIKFDSSDHLIEVAGLKVIETCNAASCTTVSATTVAVIIDSSRAVGEAWGMHPKFEEERIPYCDKVRETIWMYWGTHALDTNAIGHIING